MKIDWYRIFPIYWLQNSPTCWNWDTELNRLMDEGGITDLTNYIATIGDVKIWIRNYPYAFGSNYKNPAEVLPSVATRKRLLKLVRATLAELDAL